MSALTLILLLLVGVIALYGTLAARAYLRMRGQRVIVCPETGQAAAVTVDAAYAAVSAISERPEIRLASCSRWPDRRDCDQACATQIALSPDGTRATTLLQQWYAGRKCALCKRAIRPMRPGEPKPALLNVVTPTPEPVSLDEIPVEHLPAALDSHLPVCANCNVAETFRRQFPELVLDRPESTTRDIVVH